MLNAHGDQVLRLMEREPAATGILEVSDMPRVLALLERAVADDDKRKGAAASSDEDDVESNECGDPAVSLRQRVWPLIETIKRAHAAAQPLVWGV